MSQRKKRVGVIGYGSIGQHLVSSILENEDLELAFVWNRTLDSVAKAVDEKYILHSLDDVASRHPDLVVEVAHPDITKKYGPAILQVSDYMIGSPTALADKSLEDQLRQAATKYGLYLPSGALWGAEDIRRMADRDTLQKLTVTMTFHPQSLKPVGYLKILNDAVVERTVLYQGPIRQLCLVAPNNVNTMASAAVAAHTLGFDGVEGCLISDPSEADFHVIEVNVYGKPSPTGLALHLNSVQRNPAVRGQVTGSATVGRFFSSVLRAGGRGPGLHLC